MSHRNLSKILSHQLTPILFLVLIAFIAGLLVLKDFGVSVDEPNLHLFAKRSLDSYVYWIDHSLSPPIFHNIRRYYGPAFLMLVEMAIRFSIKLGFNPKVIEFWHFSYYLLFLLSVISLYRLSCRWFNRRTSFLVAALFVTQPLLVGHAFINPNDIPFMSIFIICIYFGLRMIDTIPAENNGVDIISAKSRFIYELSQISKRRRIYFAIMVLAGIITPILCYVYSETIHSMVGDTVGFFFNSDSSTWYGKSFLLFASQASHIPVENYINKARQWVKMLGFVVDAIYLVGMLLVLRKMFPSFFTWCSIKRLVSFLITTSRSLVSIPVILTGIFIGLTTSTRVIGPFAGLIIAVIALIKNRRKSFPLLVGVCVWAILVSYFTWPFLWYAPINNFFESLSVMSQFPWGGQTLFNGNYYRSFELPYSYVPILMSIQFTEPIIVLFCVGILISLQQFRVRPLQNELLVLNLMWFILPIIYFISSPKALYDNFRHLLFIVPPIFFMVGLSLDQLLNRIKAFPVYIAITVLALLPGVYSIINLHPYEYVYYNSFAGGTRGAFRKFEMDYWNISFHEIANDLNRIAPEKSKVVIWGAIDSIIPYMRSDLIVEFKGSNTFELDGGYDYAVQNSRSDWDTVYPEAPVLAIVERDGAIFSVLKYVQGIGPK